VIIILLLLAVGVGYQYKTSPQTFDPCLGAKSVFNVSNTFNNEFYTSHSFLFGCVVQLDLQLQLLAW
jgi:hypothetical protein